MLGRCNVGFSDCNADPKDGCETNTQNDPENCGSCGALCQSSTRTEVECSAGTCNLVKCNAGFGNCSPSPELSLLQSCATDLKTDVDNCNGCGKDCPFVPNLQRICVAGVCGSQLPDTNHRDCDNNLGNGYETDIRSDKNHCGACGVICNESQFSKLNVAGVTCAQKQCVIDQCTTGFANCNSAAADGCEVNLSDNINHCGSCNTACVAGPNVSLISCEAGACKILSCAAGWGNCDGNVLNGCEVNLNTSVNHCGSCPNKCPTVPNSKPSCDGGICKLTCDTNFDDCNKTLNDGCEADLRIDIDNCNACNNPCRVRCLNRTCS